MPINTRVRYHDNPLIEPFAKNELGKRYYECLMGVWKR